MNTKKQKEIRTICYVYNKTFDVLNYGAAVWRQARQDKNNIINYDKNKGKKIALTRLIKSPVIINNFCKNNLKKINFSLKNDDNKKRLVYSQLLESGIENILLRYIYSKNYGCSNRNSNSAASLKILERVIKGTPKIYNRLSFNKSSKSVEKNISITKTNNITVNKNTNQNTSQIEWIEIDENIDY